MYVCEYSTVATDILYSTVLVYSSLVQNFSHVFECTVLYSTVLCIHTVQYSTVLRETKLFERSFVVVKLSNFRRT